MVARLQRASDKSFPAPRRKIAIALLAGSVIAVGAVVAAATGRDDHVSGAPPHLRLHGEFGERPYQFDGQGVAGTMIDSRAAIFTIANSKNASPNAAMPCDSGPLAVNRYPLTIRDAARTTVAGGLFRGRVPQASDWRATYCNSAAISFRQSPGGVIDGVRIGRAWDAVRASDGASGLTLRGSWISEVRDDLFEDDYLYPVAIHDTLVDGAFQGLSIKPSGDRREGEVSSSLIEISGLLLRLREYPYKGEMRFGALTKNGERSPRLRIRNSIVAIDAPGGKTFSDYWARTWGKLAGSSGNSLLWLSDGPIPATFPLPPAGFTVVKGEAARRLWSMARANWIHCHPNVARQASDPRSNRSACRADRWGGGGTKPSPGAGAADQ